MNTKTKRGLKIAGISVLIAVSLVVLILLSYVAYLAVGYYRIADNLSVSVENNKTAEVTIGEEYTISTYNIGFGAYTQDFDFFMDSGVMKDGTEVTGTRARANSKESVERAVSGAIEEILSLQTDFSFFQEVDKKICFYSYFHFSILQSSNTPIVQFPKFQKQGMLNLLGLKN